MSDSLLSIGGGDHAVLCLHGWFGSAQGWGYLPELVDQETFSYFFPDMRGYGERRAETGDYSMREFARDTLAAADALDLDRFSVVGHSMGGKAAAELLAAAPGRVRALAGISPVSPAPVPMDEQSRELFFGAPDDLANRRAIIDFTTGNRLAGTWLDEMVGASARNSTRDAVAGAVASWVDDDYTGSVVRDGGPILVIAGANDPAISPEVVQQSWVQMYDDVEVVVLDGAGHYAMYEAPVALVSAIERFLTGR